MSQSSRYIRIGLAVLVVLVTILYLAATGIKESKSYYVTIKELRGMGDEAYVKHLRVAGSVVPGSIHLQGTNADFLLDEQGQQLKVSYKGAEPPPDTFKDNAQALAEGSYGRDGVFHAKQIQAKCASKYAPAKPGEKSTAGTSEKSTSM